MIELTAAEMASLEKEAALAKAGALRKTAKNHPLPVRLIENIRVQAATPQTIRRNLEGHGTHDGPIVGLEWLLIDYDSTAAIYQCECPYSFCNGTGTIEAMAVLDSRGKVELPFAAPGSLACPVCDEAIDRLYEAEAAKMADRRRPSLIAADSPRVCECGEPLPAGAHSNTKLCRPCATARALERKKAAMAAKRADHSAAS